MKKFEEILLPPLDAENFFGDFSSIGSIFYQTSDYKKIFSPSTYFILGDKGSGKTMISAYLCSGCSDALVGKNFVISVDDYNKFLRMKQNGDLNYTDYVTIWKVILLIKILLSIDKNEIDAWFKLPIFNKLQNLRASFNLAEVTKDAFSPTVFIESKEVMESLFGKIGGKLSADTLESTIETSGSSSEKNARSCQYECLRYVDKWTSFINDVSNQIVDLKLKRPHYLFVDGIDARPDSVNYTEYKECVSALIRAAYDVNHNLFCKMKYRGTGRLQIVILSRLDIFLESGLNNCGNKIADNSVYLNWALSNLNNLQESDLYKMVNNVLAEGISGMDMWTEYMNFRIPRGKHEYSSFAYCLRLTAARPRDFIKILQLLKKHLSDDISHTLSLSAIFQKDSFQNQYSSYYLQSIQSEMSFYYTPFVCSVFFSFIRTIHNLSFTYAQFKKKLNEFYQKDRLEKSFGKPLDILDHMYNLNIICLQEQSGIYRWKYRETTISNYAPTLCNYSVSDSTRFVFHWALEKSLGLYIRKQDN